MNTDGGDDGTSTKVSYLSVCHMLLLIHPIPSTPGSCGTHPRRDELSGGPLGGEHPPRVSLVCLRLGHALRRWFPPLTGGNIDANDDHYQHVFVHPPRSHGLLRLAVSLGTVPTATPQPHPDAKCITARSMFALACFMHNVADSVPPMCTRAQLNLHGCLRRVAQREVPL